MLWLAAPHTSYGAADKILRRLTIYEVYNSLRQRIGALGSMCRMASSLAAICDCEVIAVIAAFVFVLTAGEL